MRKMKVTMMIGVKCQLIIDIMVHMLKMKWDILMMILILFSMETLVHIGT